MRPVRSMTHCRNGRSAGNEGRAYSASSGDHGTCGDSNANSRAASVSLSIDEASVYRTFSHEGPCARSGARGGVTSTTLPAEILKPKCGSCKLNQVTWLPK